MKVTITIVCDQDIMDDDEDIDYTVESDTGLPVPDNEIIGILEKTKLLMVLESYGIIEGEEEDES